MAFRELTCHRRLCGTFTINPRTCKSLQHPTHCVALATTFRGILGRSVQRLADVGVAEATHQVVAIQDGLEQLHVRPRSPG